MGSTTVRHSRKLVERCRFCGRLWTPPTGATPLHYCRACSKERRAKAKAKHESRINYIHVGKYILSLPK